MQVMVRLHQVALASPSMLVVERRLEAAFERFASRIDSVEARVERGDELRPGGDKRCTVEVLLHEGTVLVVSSCSWSPLLEAVEEAIERMTHQLRQHLRRSVRGAWARALPRARGRRGRGGVARAQDALARGGTDSQAIWHPTSIVQGGGLHA